MPRLALAVAAAVLALSSAQAAAPLYIHGPGGQLPAMRDAASAFGWVHGIGSPGGLNRRPVCASSRAETWEPLAVPSRCLRRT